MHVFIIVIFGILFASIDAELNVNYPNPLELKVENNYTTDMTTISTSHSSSNSSSDATSTTKLNTTLQNFPTGESPPTRSAKLGMGLGITFIGILIIGEIIYFKCFYAGRLRSDNYTA